MSPALLTFVFVSEPVDAMLDDLTTEAAVLRVYRQAFAVLAREAGAMILDVDLIDVDEAILEAFAAAGSDGLTVAEVVAACHRFHRARGGTARTWASSIGARLWRCSTSAPKSSRPARPAARCPSPATAPAAARPRSCTAGRKPSVRPVPNWPGIASRKTASDAEPIGTPAKPGHTLARFAHICSMTSSQPNKRGSTLVQDHEISDGPVTAEWELWGTVPEVRTAGKSTTATLLADTIAQV